MRRTLFASTFALAMAAGTGTAFAEPPPEDGPPHGGCHHPRPMLMHVVHELDLSDAQKTQAKQLFEAERNAMKSQRDALHSAHQASIRRRRAATRSPLRRKRSRMQKSMPRALMCRPTPICVRNSMRC